MDGLLGTRRKFIVLMVTDILFRVVKFTRPAKVKAICIIDGIQNTKGRDEVKKTNLIEWSCILWLLHGNTLVFSLENIQGILSIRIPGYLAQCMFLKFLIRDRIYLRLRLHTILNCARGFCRSINTYLGSSSR